MTITSILFALHRDFQRTSHSHERDLKRCQEAYRSLKAGRLSNDVIDDHIESTRGDAADDAVPAISQQTTHISTALLRSGVGSRVGAAVYAFTFG